VLSHEVMGAVALAILWINALLIALAAAQQVGALLARRTALAGAVRARVIRGEGPGGAFAVQRVEQVGRAASDGEAILFHDRAAQGEVFGGVVIVEGGREIAVPASASAEVWIDAWSVRAAAACASTEEFDQAYPSACKAKGFARVVTATLGEGAEVVVSTAVDGEGILVAAMAPRALLAKKAALGGAFIAGELLAAAGCTALALHAPVFGGVSTLGGILGLGFFLAVQPAATGVRDVMLVPSRAAVRGGWARPAT
jgi:hypothetical protein